MCKDDVQQAEVLGGMVCWRCGDHGAVQVCRRAMRVAREVGWGGEAHRGAGGRGATLAMGGLGWRGVGCGQRGHWQAAGPSRLSVWCCAAGGRRRAVR